MSEPNVILFDDPVIRAKLLPFTYTRPVADIRIGILTIREKWDKYLSTSSFTITESYLSGKYPFQVSESNLIINGSFLPNKALCDTIKNLVLGRAISTTNGELIAARLPHGSANNFVPAETLKDVETEIFSKEVVRIENPWDIFLKNDTALKDDFDLLRNGRKSEKVADTNLVIGEENLFVEPGAVVNGAILNTTTGPVYIGKDTEVMEGSIIRGPFALCDHAVLKLGTKIYGATTIGPYSKIGGEVNNSVIFGYSNKAHDGFLGNSVIGEWCNLGAGTNNSNLKNNYTNVKLWNYQTESFEDTGLQFCGLFMGDHSKCGINTMFNTGTVVGVSANTFGSGFPRNFIPSFSWGGASGFATFNLGKASETAELVMARRDKGFDENEQKIFSEVFQITAKYRSF